ncbi:hypothetical protein Tco_0623342 [Tanacetum coccineum]
MLVQHQSQMGEGSAIPTNPHHTPTFIQPSPQPQKTEKPRKPKRKDTQVPQPSDSSDNVADKVVHKELGDSLVRAATTTSNLEAEQDSGNITKTRSKATPNESSSLGTTSGGGPRDMEGKKLKDLKNKSFDSIQKMFDRAFKRVNTFIDFGTDLVKCSSKRAGEELIQESSKKQKVDDDKETTKLKQCMEIIPDEEDVTINAIPLAVKSLRIIDWKIHKEGKKSYYQIIRADGKYLHVGREEVSSYTPPTLSMMLENKLQIDYEIEMAYQLCKLITKQLKNQ